jgi:hypothetical protein
MKDERIQTTLNRFAARGFCIWWVLLIVALDYRLWILKQHPREFWDILVIFCIATLYVSIASANKGVLGIFDHGLKSRSLIIGLVAGAMIGSFISLFIAGQMHSVVDVGAFLIGFLPGMGLAIGILYFLNRRWKRKEGIEDEK